jgi:CheY-like chemotaxis protein
MVVDDDAHLREIMAETLRAEDYSVQTAENGAQALKLLGRGRPDVIVLDLMMPVLDGWAFIEGYRQVAGAEIPIVSVSAALNPKMTDRLRRLGIRICLSKPFEVDALVAGVNQALAEKASMPSLLPEGGTDSSEG